MDDRYTRALTAVVAVALVLSAVTAGAVVPSHDATDGEEQTQDTSHVRVAHASPGAPAVSVTIDNETVVSDAEFGNVTDYVPVEAGTKNVTIAAADDTGDVVYEGNVTLEPRAVATIAASGDVANDSTDGFEPVVFDANAAWEPSENESAVRVAHLSPDAPAVDVVAVESPAADETEAPTDETDETDENGTDTDAESTEAPDDETAADDGTTVLAENVTFRNASDYVNVPAGDYTVEIREAASDTDGTALATVDLTLDGGQVSTAMAVGFTGAETDSEGEPFDVRVVEDASVTLHLPSEETAEGETTDNGTETTTAPDVIEIPVTMTDMPDETETETETETATDTETEDATTAEGTETTEPGTDAAEEVTDSTGTETGASEPGTATESG